MTSAATATPTNGQIAIDLFGWEDRADTYSGAPRYKTPAGLFRAKVPDYLNDPGTLDEAEAYCRERGWDWKAQQFASGVKVEIPYDRHWHTVSALADTLTEAWWTAIYRAAEAVKA